MKVAVYAISKNERKNVDRFMTSIEKFRLPVFVLDHSDDGTAELLRKRGAVVDTTPMPDFKFDAGKNFALGLVTDADYVINLDLDEELSDNTSAILSMIDPVTDRVRHLYKPDAKLDRVREDFRIHRRHGYKWTCPVHEYLVSSRGKYEKIQFIDDILITQYPDGARGHNWTKRLLKAVKDYPHDARMRLMAGRDLYFDSQYGLAVKHLEYFVTMDDASDFDKSYAYALLAQCHKKLGNPLKEIHKLMLGAEICDRRETVVALAHAHLLRGQYQAALEAALYSLSITFGLYSANSDPGAWSFKPHEIAMISSYNLGMQDEAIEHGRMALALAKDEDKIRIQSNLSQIGIA